VSTSRGEVDGDYPRALRHGTARLRSETAHERTHRRMMRLYHRLGDRTAALRQYQSCGRMSKVSCAPDLGRSHRQASASRRG
jgi:DNA-binding SARP family transcriptional activator